MNQRAKRIISVGVLLILAVLFSADFCESFGCDVQDQGEFSSGSIEEVFFAPVDLLSHAPRDFSVLQTIDWKVELLESPLILERPSLSNSVVHHSDPPSPPDLHKLLSVFLI